VCFCICVCACVRVIKISTTQPTVRNVISPPPSSLSLPQDHNQRRVLAQARFQVSRAVSWCLHCAHSQTRARSARGWKIMKARCRQGMRRQRCRLHRPLRRPNLTSHLDCTSFWSQKAELLREHLSDWSKLGLLRRAVQALVSD